MDDDEASKYGRMVADNIDQFGNVLDKSKPHLPKSGSDLLNQLKNEAPQVISQTEELEFLIKVQCIILISIITLRI